MQSLEAYNSYKLPSLTHVLYAPKSPKELRDILSSTGRLSVAVLGMGTNVVLSRQRFEPERPFITTAQLKGVIVHNNNILEVYAGTPLAHIGEVALHQSLSDFEELSTIPGSVGGAVYMNAGCYGQQIGDLVEKVEVLNRTRMRFELFTRQMIVWKYRWCSLQDENFVISRVWLRLRRGKPAFIRCRTDEIWRLQKERFPLDAASAGSVFKRPQNGPPAGELIEKIGLKGYRIGGACVSTKHAGWIINLGTATPEDIQTLIYFLRATVKACCGIRLDVEQRII